MGKITVKNLTTLTEFAALTRAGLYLAGRITEAEENGFRIKTHENWRANIVIKITEEQGKSQKNA